MKREALLEAMKNAVLGKSYDLSVAFVSSARMKELNRTYRQINKPTDILSFPLSKKEGEIYICISEAKKEAKKFDRKINNFISFLFIHGLVHLKGFDHGSTMESIEARFRKKFGV
ncbi:MAG: rRNA maturation RNase YbeY [Patescibacteria group bacterium]